MKKHNTKNKLKENYDYTYIYDDASLTWKPREEFWISKYLSRSDTDKTVVLNKVSISVNGIIVGLADRISIDKKSLEKAQRKFRDRK